MGKKHEFKPLTEIQRAWQESQDAVKSSRSQFAGLDRNEINEGSTDASAISWNAKPEIFIKARLQMVASLRQQGVYDEAVLQAISLVPRHHFVDQAFYLRAYDDLALPIGYDQTISHPSIVARMISIMRESTLLFKGSCHKVLEIGTGCGYQAAVLSACGFETFSIERVAPLFEHAVDNLSFLSQMFNIDPKLYFGDGQVGLPKQAPFDGILIAAAGMKVPHSLIEQLSIGGTAVFPMISENGTQRLSRVIRRSKTQWQTDQFDEVSFVPLIEGVVQFY